MKHFVSLIILLTFASAPAFAASAKWHSLPDHSAIHWIAKWMGTPVHGGFKKFSVSAQLNPSHLAGGRLVVVVSTVSVYASSPSITQAIHGIQWFDVAAYPRARFIGTLEKRSGRWFVSGTLTIKGVSRHLDFPITVSKKASGIVLSGRLRLERTAFGIGTGQWKNGSMIAIPVTVEFKVLLVHGPAA